MSRRKLWMARACSCPAAFAKSSSQQSTLTCSIVQDQGVVRYLPEIQAEFIRSPRKVVRGAVTLLLRKVFVLTTEELRPHAVPLGVK